MRTVLFIFSLIVHGYTNAQLHLADSLKQALQGKPRYFLGFQNRNTFIQSNKTELYGIVGGAEFSKKLKLYVGFYGFSGQNETLLRQNDRFNTDSVYRYVSTSYVSIGAEYTYFVYKRISLSVPVQVGLGSVQKDYRSADKKTNLASNVYKMMPIEAGINSYIALLPWVGIKGGVGYRLQLGQREAMQYSAPYYNLGLSILLGQIYQDLKKAAQNRK